jgi:hypothetical protein
MRVPLHRGFDGLREWFQAEAQLSWSGRFGWIAAGLLKGALSGNSDILFPLLGRGRERLLRHLRLGGVLCSLEHIACQRRTRYVLRTLDPEIHPSCIHRLKHFFGRSGVALRDAELLERFHPP